MSWCMSVMPALGKQRLKELEFKVMVPRLQSEASLKKYIYIYAEAYLCTYFISFQQVQLWECIRKYHPPQKQSRQALLSTCKVCLGLQETFKSQRSISLLQGTEIPGIPKLIKRHREEELKRELPGQKCKLSDNKAWKC